MIALAMTRTTKKRLSLLVEKYGEESKRMTFMGVLVKDFSHDEIMALLCYANQKASEILAHK